MDYYRGNAEVEDALLRLRANSWRQTEKGAAMASEPCAADAKRVEAELVNLQATLDSMTLAASFMADESKLSDEREAAALERVTELEAIVANLEARKESITASLGRLNLRFLEVEKITEAAVEWSDNLDETPPEEYMASGASAEARLTLWQSVQRYLKVKNS